MAKSTFPPVPKLLLEALEASFKNTIPADPQTSVDSLQVLQGEQHVVRFLRSQYNLQTPE